MDYRAFKRYVVRYRGEEGVLNDFNTVEEAKADIKQWKEDDKKDRELYFYEIYDTYKKEVIK